MMRISAVAVAVAAEAGPHGVLNFNTIKDDATNTLNITQAYVAAGDHTSAKPWMQISMLLNDGLLQLTSSQTSAVELPDCAAKLYAAVGSGKVYAPGFGAFFKCAQDGMKAFKDGTTEIKWFASLHEGSVLDKNGACKIDPTKQSYPKFTTLTAAKDGKTLTVAGKHATKLVLGLDGPAITTVKLSAAKKGCWNGARVVFGNNADKVVVEKFADLHPTLLAGDMKTAVEKSDVYTNAVGYMKMMGLDATKAPIAVMSGDIEAASLRRA